MEKQRCTWRNTFLSSSFETWLAIDEDTWMNVIEWWKDAHHQDWLWNNAALEGQSHIVILWNMVIDRRYHATALNECQKGTHPEDWLCGTICFEARWALHRMSMGDRSSIIDEAETFLFTIGLEELKGIYWEEHWAYNHEPLYCKLWDACLDDWMISKKADDNMYLKSTVSTRGKFMTD